MDEYLTTREIADRAGVHITAVQKAIARGEFEAQKRGVAWYCHRDALLYFGRSRAGTPAFERFEDEDEDEAPDSTATAVISKPPPVGRIPSLPSLGQAKAGSDLLSVLDDYGLSSLQNLKAKAIALQEIAKAERLQRQNLREIGELLDREEYERRLENLATITKTRLLIIPSSTAKEISQMDDPFEIEALLTEKIEDALHELADALEKENA